MLLLCERDYHKLLEAKQADVREVIKGKPEVHDAFELRFPWGPQCLLVWKGELPNAAK